MSKEEKEAALDKKMEEMRRKNAEREKRHAVSTMIKAMMHTSFFN